VSSYVHAGGRVVLAGDAAHIHSPDGGHGMNTGVQVGGWVSLPVTVVSLLP
jgi:hypothetical protein